MKRYSIIKIAIFLLLILTIGFALASCSDSSGSNEKENDEKTSEDSTAAENEANKNSEEEKKYTEELQKVPVKGGELSGILTIPAEVPDASNMPVVLFVQGSGSPPKNGVANEFGLLAESLADYGIASFRYDKRGSYDSNSIVVDESEIRVADFVQDIEEIIKYLEKDKRIHHVFLLGHSQGGLFGCLAIQNVKVDGFISVSAPGIDIGETMSRQIKENPFNPDDLVKEADIVISKLRNGEIVEEISPELAPLFRKSVQPYLIDWMSYNPIEEYKKLEGIPTIIIQGKNDIQITIDDARRLAAVIPDTEAILIDKMSHVLKDAATKEDRIEHTKIYSNVKAPINEELVSVIVDFVNTTKKTN